ncbi:hypothetical protein OY671_007991, partial [Metschnikowia pulcherrima]
MKNAMRVIAGSLGSFNVAIGLGFSLDPAIAGQRFFSASLGTQGMATSRADFTASFVGMGSFASAGAASGMALSASIAGRTGGVASFTLAGMMIASSAGALTSLAISSAPNPFALSEIVTWSMGASADRGWPDVSIASPPTSLGSSVSRRTGPALDALMSGESAARSLGVDPARSLWRMVAGVGLVVGAGVAVAGIIGFVGSVVPHLVRPFTDRRPSASSSPSASAGASSLS